MHLGGFSPRLFNVDELPKRTAVCCVTQVKSTSSKVRIPTWAIPSLHRTGRDLMQDILTCAMGLDIHRDVIVTGLAKGELGVDPEIEIPSFSTLIPDMRKLRDWVLKADCHHVAMKSTGIYCQPIYEMLEGNPYLKSVLCEVRWVTSGKRTLYLAGWYWRIKQRKGAKRA